METTRRSPRICIFDSGVGGLTILAEIKREIPGATYIYCSDNANFPYGPKSEEAVTKFTREACGKLVATYAPDVMVVACGTASTVALPHLRNDFSVPVIGVVPAIKPAAESSTTKTIGLLATPGTVTRPYTFKLIADFAAHCVVLRVGSSVLVQLAEDKARGQAVNLEAVRSEVLPLFLQSPQEASQRLDTIVLGCTHFPLLLSELYLVAPWEVRWVDSGPAIAARARTVLRQSGFDLQLDQPAGESVAVLTRDDPSAQALGPILTGFGFVRVEILR